MLTLNRALIAAASVMWSLVMGTVIVSAQAPKTATVWDGAYTDAQAERATAAFSANCARCHTLTADGSGNRPLTGDKFWEGYTQKTVGDLLKFVSTNMPNGAAAGSLSASTYNDLVALILKSNGFPSGKTEVAPETVATIQIIPKGGAGELPANTLVKMVGCLGPKSGSDWTLVNATDPVRIEKTGAVPEDATRPLGSRTITLKFVLTRLDAFAGQRMSVSGILIGAGGANGINVSTVNRVAESCP
ncbi:MAG TPA: cytochrome c [Vicinamibacterales bacterium]|jgi:mono/diheme cytochrome c family protein